MKRTCIRHLASAPLVIPGRTLFALRLPAALAATLAFFLAIGPDSQLTPCWSQEKNAQDRAKLDVEPATILNKEIQASLSDEAGKFFDLFKVSGKGDAQLKMKSGNSLGKGFKVLADSTFGMIIQAKGPGAVSISRITYPKKLTLELTKGREVDGVKLDAGAVLERTVDGSWWVSSPELREKQLVREKAAAQVKRESDAIANLKYAKKLAEKGEVQQAKERLQRIVKDYAGTKGAVEAKELLEKLQEK